MTTLARSITGGVDTHLDVHVAATLDERGTLLGVEGFATTEDSYKKLMGWLMTSAPSSWSALEGTGSYERRAHPTPSGGTGFESSKWTAPTDSGGGARASPIPKMPSRLLVPPSRAMRSW